MPVPSYRSYRLAHPGGSLNRAQAQLGKLAESLGQLNQLTSDLTLPDYGGSGEDSMTVLRLSSIYFKTTPAVMVMAVKMMPLLSAAERSEVEALTNGFEGSVQSLEQGCRTNEVPLTTTHYVLRATCHVLRATYCLINY